MVGGTDADLLYERYQRACAERDREKRRADLAREMLKAARASIEYWKRAAMAGHEPVPDDLDE